MGFFAIIMENNLIEITHQTNKGVGVGDGVGVGVDLGFGVEFGAVDGMSTYLNSSH